MRHRAYPEYRESDVEWLGQVPLHWQLPPLRARYDVQLGKMLDSQRITGRHLVPYLRNVDVRWDSVQISDLPEMDIRPDEYERYTLRLGDLLVCEGGEVGRTATWRADLELCGFQKAVHRLRPTDPTRDSPRFLYYLMRAAAERAVFVAGANPNTIPHLTAEMLRVYRFPFPSLDEQHAIVAFLNRETAKIDALVAKKGRLIELLHEKRTAFINRTVTKGLDPRVSTKASGIDGLGLMPDHWQLRRLKQVADVRQGVTKGRDLQGRATIERPYLRVANVQAGRLDLADVHSIEVGLDEVSRYELQVGDVLMNEGGDNDKLGRGAVWEGQIPGCLHQNHVFAVRPRGPSLSRWIAMVTLTEYARFFFLGRAKQSTNLASISSTNLQELPVLIPPPSERAAILNTVNQQGIAVDSLVGKVREAMERLKEYRTALISAAVTGKIDVRAERGDPENRTPDVPFSRSDASGDGSAPRDAMSAAIGRSGGLGGGPAR